MDIHHLKTLIAIVDYGSFEAAGDAVFISQSAVSQQVRTIEDFLGFKVFDRTIRPPALTVRGAVLVESARKIVMEYESVIKNLKGDELYGMLLLGATRASFKGALPKVLTILYHRFPQLHIHIQTGVSKDLVTSVETGRIDAAIIPSGTSLKKNICWLPYAIESLMVIADKQTRGKTDKELLENSNYIKFVSNSSVANLIDKELLRRNIHIYSTIEIDVLEPIIKLVQHGLGVSVFPESSGRGLIPSDIQKIPFGDPPIKRHFGVIYQNSSSKEKIISSLHNELFRLSGSPNFSGGA